MSLYDALGLPWFDSGREKLANQFSWKEIVKDAKERAITGNTIRVILRNNSAPDTYVNDPVGILRDQYIMERYTCVAVVYPNGSVQMR